MCLAAVSIAPSAGTLKHAVQTSPVLWQEAIATASASSNASDSFEFTKTLVFKPKTAKSATPVPVVVIVIAREETEMSSAALGKKLNLKELRPASADL